MRSAKSNQVMEGLETPRWYWIIVVFALLYGLLGLMQITYLPGMPDPLWTLVVYALGQIANILGAVSLALRKSISSWFYLSMAIAFVIQRVWLLIFSGQWPELPPGTPYIQMVAIAIPLLLFVFAKVGIRKNWLR